jgi:hypothetical protein
MFRHKTVMILGAGASCEAKLPAGDELKVRIVNALQPADLHRSFRDEHINKAVIEIAGRRGGTSGWPAIRDQFDAAARMITAGLPLAPSIDHFLDAHSGDEYLELLGKLAIGSVILHAERASIFAPTRHGSALDPNQVQQTWYVGLARLLFQGARRPHLESIFEHLTIVSFNYDRCIEHFLFHALQGYYSIDQKAAAEALAGLTVIHPYGRVGSLPWQEEDVPVPYGGAGDTDLVNVAESLKTFTETVEDGVATRIKDAVSEAESLIYLGFGYHPQNIELLTARTKARVKRLFATMGGISVPDQRVAEALAASVSGWRGLEDQPPVMHVQASTCAALFEKYRLMLTHELLLS